MRITHVASGLFATAGESRSQHRNRETALQRLRHRMALELREPFQRGSDLPSWLEERPPRSRLDLSQKSEIYLPTLGLVVDMLVTFGWSVSETAAAMGITTGHLVGFLRQDEKLWAHVNRGRASAGLRPLVGE